MNLAVQIGRLTKEPELRYTTTGVAVTQFTIAVDRDYTSENGERECDFIPIITWRALAESCANYLVKGQRVAVQGKINTRNYENNEGKRVYVTEVIADNVQFLEKPRDAEQSQTAQQTANTTQQRNNQQNKNTQQNKNKNNQNSGSNRNNRQNP